MNRFRSTLANWLWKLRVLLKAGPPNCRIGAGETLPLGKKAKSIRIAPMRLGQPVASFWSFWKQGDEVYAAGRNHIGVHKLSFHSSGKWYTTLGNVRKELAPSHLLPGGQWRHAVQLRYLVGDDTLPPLPETPFRGSDPGWGIEISPGEYLVAHLLIGTNGTRLTTPLPDGYGFPQLLPMELRNGTCAVLVGGPLKTSPRVKRALQIARAVRVQTNTPPDLRNLRMEIFQVEITDQGFNRVSVIPLGPESMTTTPPPGGTRLPWEVMRPS